MMRSLARYPAAEQIRQMNAALASFDAGLPARVKLLAEALRRKGLSVELSVERAIALALADSMIEKVKQLGVGYQRGMLLPTGGLGQTTTASPTPEQVVGATFQGILCSPGLATAITDAVGRSEGRDAASATSIGFAVGGGVAQCGQLSTSTVPTPSPPPEPSGPSYVVPVLVGVGTLVVAGGFLWFTKKKKG
jgi:hypothetical protein